MCNPTSTRDVSVTTSSGVRKEYLDLFELRAETIAELNRFVDEGTVVAGHRTTTEKRPRSWTWRKPWKHGAANEKITGEFQ